MKPVLQYMHHRTDFKLQLVQMRARLRYESPVEADMPSCLLLWNDNGT